MRNAIKNTIQKTMNDEELNEIETNETVEEVKETPIEADAEAVSTIPEE